MIFSMSQPPQAIGLPFNWVADYFDGTSLSEYDFITYKPNDFYAIKQNQVIRFGLIGQGMKLYFDTVDGHFNLKGKRIEIAYIDENGVTYHLTNNPNKKDLITYKRAYADFNKNTIIQRTNIESIDFGYKTIYKLNDVEFFFQPIVCLPFGSTAYMEVKLTSNKSLSGHIVFYVRGKERERFYAPLEANKSGQINWTIK